MRAPPEYRLSLPERHAGQERLAAGLKRFNVARMGRRWGKTVFGVDYLIDDDRAALGGFPVAWFAPNYKYLTEPWREAKRILRPLIVHKDEQERRIELATGGVLEFWTLDGDDPARGRKYARTVIDEAGIVRGLLDKWQQSIRPTLTDYEGGALFIGTPKGRNDFHELDQRSKKYPDTWASFHAPTLENPYIKPEELEAARLELPTLVFRQEYLAEYVDFGGAVVRPEWVQSGTPDYPWPIVLGVDLAISVKDGADYSAIVALSRSRVTGHLFVLGVLRFRATFHEILRQIEMAAERYKPVAIMVENNQFQAAVVQELLRTTKLNVRGVRRDRDKLTAFGPLAARYEQKLVHHSPDLPAYFLDELLAFTGTEDDKHDDMVDALSTAYLGLPSTVVSVASAGGRRESAGPQ